MPNEPDKSSFGANTGLNPSNLSATSNPTQTNTGTSHAAMTALFPNASAATSQQAAALGLAPNLLALNPLLTIGGMGLNPLALAAAGAFNPVALGAFNPLVAGAGSLMQNQLMQQQFIQSQMAAAAAASGAAVTQQSGLAGTVPTTDFSADPRLSQSLVSALSATSNKFIASTEASQNQSNSNGSGATESFPVKLHRCLTEMARDGLSDVASFLPHGRAFVVHSPSQFERDIMPKYFPRMKHFASFQRQLNLYNFKRIGGNGPDRGSYCHAMFWSDQPELATKMKRQKIKGLFKYNNNSKAKKNESKADGKKGSRGGEDK